MRLITTEPDPSAPTEILAFGWGLLTVLSEYEGRAPTGPDDPLFSELCRQAAEVGESVREGLDMEALDRAQPPSLSLVPEDK